jgi:FtsP/CotA-like multicopper oxidase with cupredoxin domain
MFRTDVLQPLIEANWGDTIEVTVRNEIANPPEGTAVHWHGLLHTKTPWYDGVPSVNQCPIAPGAKFTYRFQADLYGTSWYHSHYSSQYAGGLHGPLVIHGPNHRRYDTDLGPVFLSDWYHKEYFKIVKDLVGNETRTPNGPDLEKLAPSSDNILINGKMNFNCSTVNDGVPCRSDAGIAKFNFEAGKTHRLRLINSGAEALLKFSIDNHTLTVIANDFMPIRPYDTKFVTLGIGQRTDVLVKANGKPTDAVWMRVQAPTDCANARQRLALAAIYYNKANTTSVPQTTAWPDDDHPCTNDDLSKTQPVYPLRAEPNPQTTQIFDISAGWNSTGNFLWTMNGQTFRANHNKPLLLLAHQKNTSYPYDPQWNVYNFGNNRTMRFIVRNNGAFAGVNHPMHMHGHNMLVLASGTGQWDGKIVNPNNPQRRDVHMLPANGYMVVQINANNPGVWPFHCHIAWHASSGLFVNIMERPADIRQMEIPQIMQQTCVDWEAYSSRNIVDQPDSGI